MKEQLTEPGPPLDGSHFTAGSCHCLISGILKDICSGQAFKSQETQLVIGADTAYVTMELAGFICGGGGVGYSWADDIRPLHRWSLRFLSHALIYPVSTR